MTLQMDRTALAALMRRELPVLAAALEVEEVGEQHLRLRLRVDDAHLRPGGTVSGPAMFGLVDVAVYLAILSRIGPQPLAVTSSASLDFLRRPPAGADLVADCRLLKLGRHLAVGEVLIYSDALPDPVARASLTYSLPPKPAAAAAA